MNHFVWVDLSTFSPESAERFYRGVFGWSYQDDGSGYRVTGVGEHPAAGLYEMPAFFKKINMPSFWMTYIRVADITQTVERAKALGAKIELEEDNRWGRVALIRDPAGAGFTCIEGEQLIAAQDARSAGRWCWSELMVSDLSKVEPFYTGVFGWTFREALDDRYDILDAQGQRIGSVQVAPNDIKGDKEFWAVYFRVDDLSQTRQAIERAGGEVIYEHANTDGQHLLARDDQGAAFFVTH